MEDKFKIGHCTFMDHLCKVSVKNMLKLQFKFDEPKNLSPMTLFWKTCFSAEPVTLYNFFIP